MRRKPSLVAAEERPDESTRAAKVDGDGAPFGANDTDDDELVGVTANNEPNV